MCMLALYSNYKVRVLRLVEQSDSLQGGPKTEAFFDCSHL